MEQIIPFVPDQKSGQEELAGGAPLAVNVIVDKLGAVRRRPAVKAMPGISSSVFSENGIEAVHVTSEGKMFAVSAGDDNKLIYVFSGGSPSSISHSGGMELNGSKRPIIAETEAILALSAGGQMQKVMLDSNQSSRISQGPISTHVLANASRLACNSILGNRGRIYYSGIASGGDYAGHEDWESEEAGFVTAEARPDNVVALHENTNELFAFGVTNLQVFAPDETFVYAPVSTKEYGCIAPYSVVKVDQTFMWLDHMRRFVQSDGRSFRVVSQDIQETLDAMESVSNAFGYRVKTGIVDAVVWTFPEDGRSFVFSNGLWSIWMGWNELTNNFSRFYVNACCVNPVTGAVVVGTTDGRVGELRVGGHTDLGGGRIVANITTGYIHRGTDSRKHCKGVRLSLRRGHTVSSNEPTALLSWRDDGGPWNSPIQVGLGHAGDHDSVVSLRSLGTYRRRQWRFEFDGDDELVLVSATEEFDVLGA